MHFRIWRHHGWFVLVSLLTEGEWFRIRAKAEQGKLHKTFSKVPQIFYESSTNPLSVDQLLRNWRNWNPILGSLPHFVTTWRINEETCGEATQAGDQFWEWAVLGKDSLAKRPSITWVFSDRMYN